MANNPRPIDYQITRKMFDSMLQLRTDAEQKMNPYQYVMQVINNEFGLRGTVKHLSII